MQNIRFWAPSWHLKWNTMQWRDLSIAAWLFHNLHGMYKDVWRIFGQHIWGPFGKYCVILNENNSQILCKISHFVHPLKMGNGIPCYKERHPLLLEHSMTFLRCIMIMRGAFDSIYEPLMIRILSFLVKRTLKFIPQIRSGTSFQHEWWDVSCCVESSIAAWVFHNLS